MHRGTAANGGATSGRPTHGSRSARRDRVPVELLRSTTSHLRSRRPTSTTRCFASRSTDGGLTWSDPVVVKQGTAPTVFNDKQTITADPTNANFVYAVWDRLVFPGSERASVSRLPDELLSAAPPGSPDRRTRRHVGACAADLGPGSERPDDRQPDRRPAERGPGGPLHRVQQRKREEAARRLPSASCGPRTRAPPGPAPFDVARLRTIGATDPETGDAGARRGHHPRHRGRSRPQRAALYAVSQDASLNGGEADATAFSQSVRRRPDLADPSIKVNKTPTGVPIGNQQAFTPRWTSRPTGPSR